MISARSLTWLVLLALAGCKPASPPNAQAPQSTQARIATAAFSPAERRLLEGGASETDVLAARAFLLPHTKGDPATCFGTAKLDCAAMAPASGAGDPPRLTRVAIAIDGSGSMAGRVGSSTKLELAREATLSFIDGLPDSVPVSLAVFGQQGDNSERGKAKSCSGIDMLASMSPDRAKLRSAAGEVRAVGWTPLASGLRAARQQLGPSSVPGEQIVYVVSDGVETCGGNPVAVARDINRGATRAIVNIIGFGLPTGEAAALQSVASAGGGRFVNVNDDSEFQRAMAGFREQMRLAENLVGARIAQSRNAITTGVTTSDAVLCTGRLIDHETQGALVNYDAREKRGEKLPPRYQIVALLKERHDAFAAQRDAHIRRLDATRDGADIAVEAARKAAQ